MQAQISLYDQPVSMVTPSEAFTQTLVQGFVEAIREGKVQIPGDPEGGENHAQQGAL